MKNKKAFTLPDLIITVAIMGILSVISLMHFDNARKSKIALEAGASEFELTLREAQNYALTGKKTGTDIPCGFGVLKKNQTEYALFYNFRESTGDCNEGIPLGYDSSESQEIVTKILPSGIKFSSGAENSIYFTIPNAKIFNHEKNSIPVSSALTWNEELENEDGESMKVELDGRGKVNKVSL